MEKMLILAVGSDRFCVDSGCVEEISTAGGQSPELEAGQNHAEMASVFSLADLLPGAERDAASGQLVVLGSENGSVGLLVEKIGALRELAGDAVQDLPAAFGDACRACFPRVVLDGGRVFPLITVAGLREMSRLARERSAARPENDGASRWPEAGGGSAKNG